LITGHDVVTRVGYGFPKTVTVDLRRIVGQYLATFQEFPPQQKPGSFSVDQVMEKLTERKGD